MKFIPIPPVLEAAFHDARSDWQPIETAPRDGTVVLAYDPEWYRYPHPMAFEDGEWVLWFRAVGKMRPTHWMPLPSPPGEEVKP